MSEPPRPYPPGACRSCGSVAGFEFDRFVPLSPHDLRVLALVRCRGCGSEMMGPPERLRSCGVDVPPHENEAADLGPCRYMRPDRDGGWRTYDLGEDGAYHLDPNGMAWDAGGKRIAPPVPPCMES